MKSDFDKYRFPYIDLFRVNFEGSQPTFYNTDLLQILETENSNQFLLKMAFVGNDSSNSSSLKSIYNILATIENNEVYFSRALNYYVANWNKVKRYPITYYISPKKNINEQEIKNQLKDIEILNEYFETDSIEISYYSCVNPIELFQIKGFDYSAGMYFNKKGGIVEFGNHVFSGNSSEYYTHEITHIYINTLFPGSNSLLNEGIATFFGGSGGLDYNWHKKNLIEYIDSNKDFDFSNYTEAFNKIYVDEKTPIPYMTGALIYEYVLEKYDKNKFFEILKSKADLWIILNSVNLNKDNLNSELLKQLKKGH
ncbi:hypothetical protein GYB57_10065 [bacterium]|nr:hypothetical protein [bacterium]